MQNIKNDENFDEVEYVAVLDALNVQPDGSEGDQKRWMLDAIPCGTLNRLGVILESDISREEVSAIDFLLLSLEEGKEVPPWISQSNDYLNVTVSRRSRGGDEEFRAFALARDDDFDNHVQFFVQFRKDRPNKRHIKTLEEISKFLNIKDTETLEQFTPIRTAVAVAVYDVGQGSMCALVDEYEHPVIFFDLGWPLWLFPKSVPATRGHFDPFPVALNDETAPTPVVLSHLDWDHWAYACKSGVAKWDGKIGAWKTNPIYRPEALARPWLMRRPDFLRHKLSGSHIHFVQTLSTIKLNGSGVLHFWPKGKRSKDFGMMTVFTCSPATGTSKAAPFLRNNQGLGLLVKDTASGARVLLTGDADFPSIPSFAKKRLTGLVATHHGGKITSSSMPVATGHGRMVISAYPGCYPNIPHPDVQNEAQIGGWSIAYTSERKQCFRSDKSVQCGNRLIRLSKTPMCGCAAVPRACLCISRDVSPSA